MTKVLKYGQIHCPILYLIACLLVVWAVERCEPAAVLDAPQLAKDEKLVVENMGKGISTKFEGNPGILSADFVRQLLSGSVGVLKEAQIISIKNAKITGELDLSYQTIKPFVSLQQCRFDGAVSLSWSVFAKGLNLSGQGKGDRPRSK